MDEKELEKILAKAAENNGAAISAAVKQEIAEAAKGLMTAEKFEANMAAYGLKKDAIKELTEAVTKQGLEISKMLEKKDDDGGDIEKTLHKHAEAIKALASSDKGTVKMKVDKTLVQRSVVSNPTMGVRVPGVGQLPTRAVRLMEQFRNVNLTPQEVLESNGVIRYMDQNAITRNAAPVAEGNAKPEAAISWIERSINLQTIAEHIPVTKQAYRNLGFVAGEIDTLLQRDLMLAVDSQLYSGDGNTPNLKGLLTSAPAVVLASLPSSGLIEGANLYDLIANLRVYISNGAAGTGKQSKYMANRVLMNPADILRYKLAKATDGHYILPPFISADGAVIDGIQVVETPIVTANTLVLGDFNYGTIYTEESYNVTMGWINDQFTKNQWTILAEQVLALLIRIVDEDAFVEVPNITSAIAQLETP